MVMVQTQTETKRVTRVGLKNTRKAPLHLGIAENTYPNPEGINFSVGAAGAPSSRLSVNLLTRAFMEHASVSPRPIAGRHGGGNARRE